MRTYDQLCEGYLLMKRIIELREAGKTAEQTADTLNAEGFEQLGWLVVTTRFAEGWVTAQRGTPSAVQLRVKLDRPDP